MDSPSALDVRLDMPSRHEDWRLRIHSLCFKVVGTGCVGRLCVDIKFSALVTLGWTRYERSSLCFFCAG